MRKGRFAAVRRDTLSTCTIIPFDVCSCFLALSCPVELLEEVNSIIIGGYAWIICIMSICRNLHWKRGIRDSYKRWLHWPLQEYTQNNM